MCDTPCLHIPYASSSVTSVINPNLMRHVLKLDSLKGKRICFGQWSLASELSGEVKARNRWEAAAKWTWLFPPSQIHKHLTLTPRVCRNRNSSCRAVCGFRSLCCGLSPLNFCVPSNFPAREDDHRQVLHTNSCLAGLLMQGSKVLGGHCYCCSTWIGGWLENTSFWLFFSLEPVCSLLVAAGGGCLVC